MDVTKKLQEISDSLDEIDAYYGGLTNELSDIDLKIQDLLHYVECNKINILWAYKYIFELKRLRMERRRIKRDMTILGKYTEHKNKLVSTDNRKFLMVEIHKITKQLETPYKNRKYKDGEIEEILTKNKEK